VTVFIVRTYVVKPDKLTEHNEWGKKLVALMKEKPGLFKGVKSMKVFNHKYGGSVGGFTAMWGFEKLSNIKGWEKDFNEIPEEMALRTEFLDLVVPGSYSACIWESIKTMTRKAKPKLAKNKLKKIK
jgi:hypothetical protein